MEPLIGVWGTLTVFSLAASLSLSLVTNPLPSLAGGNGQLLRWCWPLGEQHQHFAGAAAEGGGRRAFPPFPLSFTFSSFTFAYTWSTGGKQDT